MFEAITVFFGELSEIISKDLKANVIPTFCSCFATVSLHMGKLLFLNENLRRYWSRIRRCRSFSVTAHKYSMSLSESPCQWEGYPVATPETAAGTKNKTYLPNTCENILTISLHIYWRTQRSKQHMHSLADIISTASLLLAHICQISSTSFINLQLPFVSSALAWATSRSLLLHLSRERRQDWLVKGLLSVQNGTSQLLCT